MINRDAPARNSTIAMISNVSLVAMVSSLALSTLDAHEGAHTRDSTSSLKVARKSEVNISEEGGKRIVEANGLPNHKTGKFPNQNNPHQVFEQLYRFEMPLKPEQLDEAKPVGRQPFGVALNGVVFDADTAESWRGDESWTYEALTGPRNLGLDESHAHVRPSGAYHYHSLPKGLLEELDAEKKWSNKQMVLVGWAADGFPIYARFGHSEAHDKNSELKELKSSYVLKKEARPDAPEGPGGEPDGSFTSDYEYVEGHGDLDEYNGRVGVTKEYPDGTYYYVLTDEFPYIPRMFMGEPDSSFERKVSGGGRGQHNRRGRDSGPRHRHTRPPHPPRF